MARYDDNDIKATNTQIARAIMERFPTYQPNSASGGYTGNGIKFIHKGVVDEGKLGVKAHVNLSAGTESVTVKLKGENANVKVFHTSDIAPMPLSELVENAIGDMREKFNARMARKKPCR